MANIMYINNAGQLLKPNGLEAHGQVATYFFYCLVYEEQYHSLSATGLAVNEKTKNELIRINEENLGEIANTYPRHDIYSAPNPESFKNMIELGLKWDYGDMSPNDYEIIGKLSTQKPEGINRPSKEDEKPYQPPKKNKKWFSFSAKK